MQNDNTPHTKFKRILVGVDDSPDAQLAFRYAISEARLSGASLVIASVLESDNVNVFQALNKDFVHGERKDLAEHLNQYRELALRAGVKTVDTVVEEGDPGEVIVKTIIPAVHADLLIVGSLSKTGVRKYFGSQAAYMAKYSPISVMVVR
ncbi:universal stress protein [Lentilactobacillus kefiri]|mgnify:CR=1 FL=1|uniref:Universal stress family protein n=2 Tax=Lentilactobacillus kefiri TaxID=33962 RepID=A0A8E1RJZ8_LENKE|nr:universal stress protein [Lentilactobacillus kefiri]KRL72685.1 universal stress family protein [Lentilactobacillus parakefiri DSM 10551]KRM52672.1 universal stress family protein [Lentilactobacillus kefiri DSM 20587 = JCM 5818]MCJ2161412.1 universal stress protein [Lentilactobacillus kefiri]MCP9368688.1 universal stress protein [Lentilactobacillus kefiri]MDH5107955.1 universal stress protein [Lentilactobacillus kefiri]